VALGGEMSVGLPSTSIKYSIRMKRMVMRMSDKVAWLILAGFLAKGGLRLRDTYQTELSDHDTNQIRVFS
jgi:hypothetical protein